MELRPSIICPDQVRIDAAVDQLLVLAFQVAARKGSKTAINDIVSPE